MGNRRRIYEEKLFKDFFSNRYMGISSYFIRPGGKVSDLLESIKNGIQVFHFVRNQLLQLLFHRISIDPISISVSGVLETASRRDFATWLSSGRYVERPIPVTGKQVKRRGGTCPRGYALRSK